MSEIIATINRDGRITIPASIRKRLGLQAGDKVFFVTHDDGRIEMRSSRLSLEDVIGSIEALPGESADLDREIKEATEEAMALKMRRWNRQ